MKTVAILIMSLVAFFVICAVVFAPVYEAFLEVR